MTMTRPIRLFPALLLPLLALIAGLPAAAAGPSATLADLAWMEGSWHGEGIAGAPAVEAYSAAADGAMPGHFRQLNPDGSVMFYELIAFVEAEGSLVLKLKHFNADLTGWEEKDDVRSFPLTEVGEGRWAFGGIVYERTGASTMLVSVAMRNDDGSRESLTFTFRKAE
jgi:hypothetical protein